MVFVAVGALSGLWLLALLPVRARALAGRVGRRARRAALARPGPGRRRRRVGDHVAAHRGGDRARAARAQRPGRGDARPRRALSPPAARSRSRGGRCASCRSPIRISVRGAPSAACGRVIADLVAHEPDLVLLTGDFLTMEGAGSPGALARALEPLRAPARPLLRDLRQPRPRGRATRCATRSPPTASRCWSTTRRWSRRRSARCRSSAPTGSGRGGASTSRRCSRASRAATAICASSCCTTRSASGTCRRATST